MKKTFIHKKPEKLKPREVFPGHFVYEDSPFYTMDKKLLDKESFNNIYNDELTTVSSYIEQKEINSKLYPYKRRIAQDTIWDRLLGKNKERI